MAAKLPVKPHGPVLRLDYADCILRGMDVDEINQSLSEFLSEADKPRLIISFQDVENLTSATLGMLLTVEKVARRKGGAVRLCEIGAKIRGLFHVTRINQIIPIDGTVNDSATALTQPPAPDSPQSR
jgi:anti-anti-sigma factor